MSDTEYNKLLCEYNELQFIFSSGEGDRDAIWQRLEVLKHRIGRESAKRQGWS